jgi:hypothetical protein
MPSAEVRSRRAASGTANDGGVNTASEG